VLFFYDCALFVSFCFFFCVAIVIIVCAPNRIFRSFFTLFLAACWLSLIPRLQTSGGSTPQAVVSSHRRCSSLVPSLAVLGFGLASVLLQGSSLFLEPCASPSEGPSSLPSRMLSPLLSSKKSDDPSSAPSLILSEKPSSRPTTIPSQQPSSEPSSVLAGDKY
jgi:hypothetical protein